MKFPVQPISLPTNITSLPNLTSRPHASILRHLFWVLPAGLAWTIGAEEISQMTPLSISICQQISKFWYRMFSLMFSLLFSLFGNASSSNLVELYYIKPLYCFLCCSFFCSLCCSLCCFLQCSLCVFFVVLLLFSCCFLYCSFCCSLCCSLCGSLCCSL